MHSAFLFALTFLLSSFHFSLTMPKGRPTDSIWNGFQKVNSATGPRAVCLGCGEEFSGQPSRMKRHLETCKKLQELVSGGLVPGPVPFTPPPPGSASSASRQLKLSPVRTPEGFQHELNLQLCRFVLATAVLFRCVAHPEFKKLVDMLRAGCSLAGEREVAGDLLDVVHGQCLEEVRKSLNGRKVTLSIIHRRLEQHFEWVWSQ